MTFTSLMSNQPTQQRFKSIWTWPH